MPKKTQTKLESGKVKAGSKEAEDRFVAGYTKGVDLAGRTVDGIASTINLDRDGEVILPSAFSARLDKFKDGNRPFLAAHTHRAASGEPTQIGWVVEITVTAAAVPCKFRFATTENAEQWWKLASDPDGKGIAFSIGFRPIRWVQGSVADLVGEFPELKGVFAAANLRDDDHVRVYTEIELYEISGCAVPSNREAQQVLAAKMAKLLAGKTDDVLLGAEPDAENLLKKFRDDLAEAVVARLDEAPARETRLSNALNEKIDQAVEKMSALVVEQIDEIKIRLPDTVNPPASDPCPGPDDRGPDAAADTGAKTRAAAKSLGGVVRKQSNERADNAGNHSSKIE